MASEPMKPTPRPDQVIAETAKTTTPVAPVPTKLPPLFRAIDWMAFGLTALCVFLGYMYTLAPDLTLEDSGELAVASLYAGVPHPPGYPVWTIYTWLFTELIPFGNIAWRVGISSAFAGAMTCGLIALMVSRGSSMFVESIVEFRAIARRVENWICLVSGFVSGMLIGFNGFMWSQAVIVEVYTLSMLSLVGVLCCLLRWTYGPTHFRYVYFAWFLCGIAFNNHQSLLVITIAMEVLMILVQPRLGRAMMLWNFIGFVAGLILQAKGRLSILSDNTPVLLIFWAIGLASAAMWVLLSIRTKARPGDLLQDAIFAGVAILGLAVFGMSGMMLAVGLAMLVFLGIDIYSHYRRTSAPWGPYWRKAIASSLAFMLGAAFYLYMPLSSMTNPPLNWGYPRTVAGFVHAFTRGQYERIRPTAGTGDNIVEQTISFVKRYAQQTWYILIEGPMEEFNLVYTLVGLIPLFFYRRFQARERYWLIGLVAFYIILGPFLLELFNPAPDRQSLSLNKPFFIASHVIIAMAIGYGLTLLMAELITAYNRFRAIALGGFAVAAGLALYSVFKTYEATPYNVLRMTAVVGFVLALAATLLVVFARSAAPVKGLLCVFMLMPLWPILGHWSENEQRGHLFGYWFGHDMFTPPFKDAKGKLSYNRKAREEQMKTPEGQKFIYPEMTKDAILFGGTDPGRFCPTYMIFCESFIEGKDKPNDPAFDRRDVYIITQNALADGTYLQYIRGHYFRSDEYKYDAPFFQDLMRGEREKELNFKTNLLARAIAVPLDRLFGDVIGDGIEKSRRAGSSMFKESDFTDLAAFAAKLRDGGAPAGVSKYIREHLSQETVRKLGTANDDLRAALVEDLNRIIETEYEAARYLSSKKEELNALRAANKTGDAEDLQKEIAALEKVYPLYETNRFSDVKLSDYMKGFVVQNPRYHNRIRMNRLLLEEAYPNLIAKSPGGVYPDREIYTPTQEDSQRCFQEYMADAQARMQRGQLKPGEDVRVIDNKVQVSGQVAVMAINGLLTKVIFDNNPQNEFFVEESFPLDWMYPHLTPYGIIMKINREPLRELSQEIVDKDHKFWSDYSERLIGNWITYDTPVSEIVKFAERVYINKDYRGFKGDPKFVRDDDGQKAFSKLRSSIAGVYAWRLANGTYPLARGSAAYNRILREAEFSFKQAYAFCPYSPEALYRYVNLLAGIGRFDDAVLLAKTSYKLDPGNSQLDNLVKELERLRGGGPANSVTAPPNPTLQKAETDYLANPSNFNLAVAYAQEAAKAGDSGRVLRVADDILANPRADASMIQFAMQIYMQLQQFPKLEESLQRWTKLNPTPEAWLDLAGAQAMQGKNSDAIASLRQCVALNAARLKANPGASNIALTIGTDNRFTALRAMPEFQSLLQTK